MARTLAGLVLAGATLAGFVLAGSSVIQHDNGLEGAPVVPAGTASRPSAPAKGRIHVAVVLGRSGTEAADVLAPYEVFARSPKFSVTTIAEDLSAVQLAGAPALLPSGTFSDVDHGRVPAPDLLVVPAVNDPLGTAEASTRLWIARQSARGGRILGVCSGSILLAATGVLDGHQATSHWSRIAALRKSRPEVQWLTGRRYVQDGRITTTAGVTSGIAGALKLVQDLAGSREAARVADEVRYPGWSPSGGTVIANQAFSGSDVPVGLNAVVPWFRPTVGIGLTDGIDEIDAVAAFEAYTVSGAARTVALASTSSIRTSHGLVLLPATTSGEEPSMDRLILPGAAARDPRLSTWAAERSIPAAALMPAAYRGNAFDAALEDVSRHEGSAAAMSTAKFIDYPTAQLTLASTGMNTRSLGLSILAVAAAIGAGALPRLIRTTHNPGRNER